MFFEKYLKPQSAGTDQQQFQLAGGSAEQDDRIRVKKLFDTLDANHDGRVDVSEIARKLREIAKGTATSPLDEGKLLQLARDLVESAKASNGHTPAKEEEQPSLSLEEFTSWLLNRERNLKTLFAQIDLDRNAHIDSEELRQWLAAANIHMSPDQVGKLMTRIDSDGNRTIEWDEFREFAVFIPPQEAQRSDHAPSQQELVVFYSTIFGQVAAGDQLEMGYAVPPKASSSELSRGKTFSYLFCGALAAAVARTATAPLDRLRVYFQNKTNRLNLLGGGAVRGAAAVAVQQRFGQEFLKAVKDIYANGGLRSFWRGNSLELLKMIPGSAFQFTAFEFSKSFIAKQVEGKNDRAQISDLGRFAAGGLAGAVAMIAGFPLSTVKTRIMSSIVTDQSAQLLAKAAEIPVLANAANASVLVNAQQVTPQRIAEASEKSIPLRSHIALRTAKEMWESGGIRPFYRGLPVALIGIVPYSGESSFFCHLSQPASPT